MSDRWKGIAVYCVLYINTIFLSVGIGLARFTTKKRVLVGRVYVRPMIMGKNRFAAPRSTWRRRTSKTPSDTARTPWVKASREGLRRGATTANRRGLFSIYRIIFRMFFFFHLFFFYLFFLSLFLSFSTLHTHTLS